MSLGDKVLAQTKTCLVSAGHSYKDPGASGNGLTEADVVLELRDLLHDRLESMGAKVSRDGKEGQNLPLSQAITMAKQVDVAVELHCNSFHRPSATGVETLQNPSDRPFGRKICNALADAMGISNRGPKGEASGQHIRLGFISKGGGLIVELFFLSNPDDLKAYRDNKDAVVEALASCIVKEITEYV